MSKYWFCKMREETYASIPFELRSKFVSERVIYDETEEMKQDEQYNALKKRYVKAREDLDKHKFKMRYPQ